METKLTVMLPDEETCWQALIDRNSCFNGFLYYGVKSTGIYCRPTCSSRRPNRDQVAFFTSPDEAEAAGFRACKRCLPRAAEEPRTSLVKQACQILDSASETISLSELAARLHVSPFHLQRTFKAVTGVSPRQYAARQRVESFKAQLKQGQAVTDAIYEAGYSSSSRLYEKITSQMGMTPTHYRKGGRGMTIHFATASSSLGRVLVAATEKGICAVSFANSEAELLDFLRREFPEATLQPDDGALVEWLQIITAYLERDQRSLALPLDLQATAFQQRVWQELRHIPYGETRSYAQVAQSIGQPKAVRAVAQACATNPAVLVTPCHRVVRSDGSLGGYRYGIERKKALLEHEQAQIPASEEWSI